MKGQGLLLSSSAMAERNYFSRALFSVVWVTAAFTLGQHSSTIGAVLLFVYPAWDALANYNDASRSVGFRRRVNRRADTSKSGISEEPLYPVNFCNM